MRSAGLLVLVLAAIYWAYSIIYVTEQTTGQNDSSIEASVTPEALPSSLGGLKGMSEIQAKASADSDGATVNSIKLEHKNNALAYGVRLSDGRVRYYDASSGQLLTETKQESAGTATAGIPDGFVASVTMEQARALAVDRVPLEEVVQISLETDKGQPMYCVYFTGGSRVYVSATDGTIAGVQGQPQVPGAAAEQPTGQDKTAPADSAASIVPEAPSADTGIPDDSVDPTNPEPQPVEGLLTVPVDGMGSGERSTEPAAEHDQESARTERETETNPVAGQSAGITRPLPR